MYLFHPGHGTQDLAYARQMLCHCLTPLVLAESISRQPSIQTVAWLLLDTFRWVNSKNLELREEQENLKNCSLARIGVC